jgi:hypothetical protein
MSSNMKKSEQILYPVQAIVDLANDFSHGHFEYAVQQCRAVISQVIAEDDSSEQQIARVRILKYVDLQLSRAVRWIDQESDLMALVLRTLIELRFWTDFVSQGSARAEHFLNEASSDSKELYEHLLRAFPEESIAYSIPSSIKRIRPTRNSDAEELLWKMCSKFIHPSSLVLHRPELTISNEEYRRVFAIKVLYYGWGILEMFHDIIWTD